MPRLVDYASRYAFLRIAAFTIVAEQGVQALSRPALAARLGTSTSSIRRILAADIDLRELAIQEADERRRRGRWARAQGGPAETAVHLLRQLIADDPPRIAEELVWWRLALSVPVPAATESEREHPEGPLRTRFQVADRGWADEPVEPEEPDESSDCGAATDPLIPVLRARSDHEDRTVTRALDLLSAGEDPAATHLTRALVTGVGLATATGDLTPAQGVGVLADHVHRLLRAGT